GTVATVALAQPLSYFKPLLQFRFGGNVGQGAADACLDNGGRRVVIENTGFVKPAKKDLQRCNTPRVGFWAARDAAIKAKPVEKIVQVLCANFPHRLAYAKVFTQQTHIA